MKGHNYGNRTCKKCGKAHIHPRGSSGKNWKLEKEALLNRYKPRGKYKHPRDISGDKNPMRNPKTARKVSRAKKGRPNPKLKMWWKTHKEEQMRKLMKGASLKQPNSIEKKLIEIIKQNNLPFKYVGNWQLIIGGKCPDFIENNGKKELLELFGTYWHTERSKETTQDRIKHFKKFGFDCLIIWEKELQNEEKLVRKIETFGGGSH